MPPHDHPSILTRSSSGPFVQQALDCESVVKSRPLAGDRPRSGAGRKGDFGGAPRWRKRHPCPRRRNEQSGQYERTGEE